MNELFKFEDWITRHYLIFEGSKIYRHCNYELTDKGQSSLSRHTLAIKLELRKKLDTKPDQPWGNFGGLLHSWYNAPG